MKKCKITALCAMLALAVNAANMEGIYNTWLGYLAGLNSSGMRTTLQGAGAGGEADDLYHTDLIGAVAGVRSCYLEDCVGIGFGALAYATNMNSVVAIGKNALRNRSNLTKATWINGQFYASANGNTFWMKANPDTPDTNAPIYYADGVLHLRAEIVDINGSIATNIPGSASGGASSLDGYDLYVDPVNGSDLYSGTTPNSAKQTIDAAIACVTTNDMKICLLPGVHAAPTSGGWGGKDQYASYRTHLMAPYGASRTVLDGGGGTLNGSLSLFSNVQGCTLRNFGCQNVNWQVFVALAFVDCVFDGDMFRYSRSSRKCFVYCVFIGCMANVTLTYTSDPGAGSADNQSYVFQDCDMFDSVFLVSSTNNPCRFADGIYVENSFIYASKAEKFDELATGSPLGNTPGYLDCTLICQNAASVASRPAANCIIGVDVGGAVPSWGNAQNSIVTNSATVIASISSGYRPAVTDWRFRYLGYNSAADRAVRNSLCNSVMSALADEDAVIATNALRRAALMSAISANEAADAPSSANRDWRGCTNILDAAALAARFDPEATDE